MNSHSDESNADRSTAEGSTDCATPSGFDSVTAGGRSNLGVGDATRVLVMFAHDGNRRQVVDVLQSTFDVVTSQAIEDLDERFDCCLVDAPMFSEHRGQLTAARDDSPTAPPILLSANPEDLEAASSTVWRDADDILKKPVGTAELRARIEDAVERHALVERVARSESRFRALFETAPDPAFVLDADQEVLAVNEAFCALTGLDRTDCVGESLTTLSVFDDEVTASVAAAVDGTGASEFEEVSYVTDGEEVGIANVRVQRVTADDVDVQCIALFRDVTERVHRTEELERQNDRLEEFAQILSHELRNPLNIADGRLKLAAERTTGAADQFERVRDAHERIEEMISELLALSRQGDVIGDTSTADFEVVVEDAWDRTPTADATLSVDSCDAYVTGDLNRVKDAFGNLFRNAVEHGCADACVRVGPLDDEAGFYVEDDGGGIPVSDREDIFEAGFTTCDDGTGFGLAIVDQIISAHNWSIEYVDGGDGARFEVTGLTAEHWRR